ncbi:MAG: DoxX family protein [Candidatus Azobacteroides sp.]|nr:DoxX family protein [Candidatus Azobacteroides sp.]
MKKIISPKVRPILILVFQVLTGATFIFSGFVKAVDPVGFAIKIQDYLTSFGADIFIPMAFPVAVVLSTLEFLLGINMLLGMHVKTTYILTLIFMAVMTPLTFYLALFNPVSDCGCFGEALIISNWATFWKNIVLSAMVIFVFIFRKNVKSPYSEKTQWLTSFSSIIFIVGIALIGYRHLPILDFRPYKIGTNIPEAMKLPEGAPQDEYQSVYIYKKNGVEKKFDRLEDAPVGDSTWTFVDAGHTLIKKGAQPLIHDFSIVEADTDEDITDDVLHSDRYIFLLISEDLRKANIDHIDNINDIYDYAKENGYGFYCLTASTPEQISRWANFTGAEYPFCKTDETTLKTILRSNPGLMLIKNGTIYNKWHYNDFPDESELRLEPLDKSPLGQIATPHPKSVILMVSISFVVLLLLVFGLDKLALYISARRRKTPI